MVQLVFCQSIHPLLLLSERWQLVSRVLSTWQEIKIELRHTKTKNERDCTNNGIMQIGKSREALGIMQIGFYGLNYTKLN